MRWQLNPAPAPDITPSAIASVISFGEADSPREGSVQEGPSFLLALRRVSR